MLLPVFGKDNASFTCDLKTQVKEYAYANHKDGLTSESPADYKAWMVQHDYDPEHGKNMPTRTAAPAQAAGQTPPPAPAAAAPGQQ